MHPLYIALMAEQRRNDLLSEAEAARNAALARHQRKRRTRLGRGRAS
jgi:hypothetical protein